MTLIFEADDEIRQLRHDLARVEEVATEIREKLHARILQKMKETGMLDRRVHNTAKHRRRWSDR